MRIIFTKDGGNPVCELIAASKDHWDACLIGHQMMTDGFVGDADDFIVTPINCTRAEVDATATTLVQERCG